ncbi:histone H2A-Bbd type 1 [Chionomys nivalis]|uniref:histone H2A-Bbd type 1 n=1 Tax=Chionomys nivalis TaxID=269649 RepID=UPI002597737B|nr:histone H2A-Bbd type 1 [Chionomys nivalis]
MEDNRQKSNTSRSARAQLNFSVSRIERFLREGNFSQRLSASAPVFLAGVLEYLTADVLDLSGKEAQANGKKRITPEHVSWAIENNKHLRKIFKVDNKPVVAEPSKPYENYVSEAGGSYLEPQIAPMYP